MTDHKVEIREIVDRRMLRYLNSAGNIEKASGNHVRPTTSGFVVTFPNLRSRVFIPMHRVLDFVYEYGDEVARNLFEGY